jgi:thioester reductase-like protein
MSVVHAVAGATGFVGRALVLRLLDRTDADVVCLVRPSSRPEQTGARLVVLGDLLTRLARDDPRTSGPTW